MFTIFKITKPCLQCRRVVFSDNLAVCDNVCFTGNGSPFASGVEEGNVDFGVGFQVISLARLSVCMEEEINTTAFL